MSSSNQEQISVKCSIIAKVFFFAGMVFGILGCVIDFVPGAECSWFLVTAFLVAVGLLIPQWNYRVLSLIFLALVLFAADEGNKHGIEYQRRLSEHPTLTPK